VGPRTTEPQVKKVAGPPPFQITPHETHSEFLKAIVYGEYGAGKTRLVGTAAEVPEMCDVLFIDAEAGALTLQNDLKAFQTIDFVRVSTFQQVSRVQEFLKLHHAIILEDDMDRLIALEARMKGLEPGDIKEPKRYRTAILDSLTEIESFSQYKLLGITEDTKIDEDVASPEWPEYKRNLSQMQRLLRKFRDLPMHLLITCARQYRQDEQKRQIYSPKMTGQLSSDIQGFVDLVGYLRLMKKSPGAEAATEPEDIPRRMYVHPVGRFDAKCRFASYKDAYFTDPTIKGILEAVGLTSVAK
jgi:hypothetical protein